MNTRMQPYLDLWRQVAMSGWRRRRRRTGLEEEEAPADTAIGRGQRRQQARSGVMEGGSEAEVEPRGPSPLAVQRPSAARFVAALCPHRPLPPAGKRVHGRIGGSRSGRGEADGDVELWTRLRRGDRGEGSWTPCG